MTERKQRLRKDCMRKTLPLLAALAITGVLVSGCASSEKKFGRGMTNVIEPLRMGELRRSMEQTAGRRNGPTHSNNANLHLISDPETKPW